MWRERENDGKGWEGQGECHGPLARLLDLSVTKIATVFWSETSLVIRAKSQTTSSFGCDESVIIVGPTTEWI